MLTKGIDDALKDLRIAEEPASEACKPPGEVGGHAPGPPGTAATRQVRRDRQAVEYNELVLAASKADRNFEDLRGRRILCRDRKGDLKMKLSGSATTIPRRRRLRNWLMPCAS